MKYDIQEIKEIIFNSVSKTIKDNSKKLKWFLIINSIQLFFFSSVRLILSRLHSHELFKLHIKTLKF